MILTLIILCGINASSAHEINNTNVDSTQEDITDTSNNIKTDNVLTSDSDTSNNVKSDISENTIESTKNSNIGASQENIDSSNSNNNILSTSQTNEQTTSKTESANNNNKKSYLSVASTSIVNGKKLKVYLKDSTGKGISGQKITITFNNKKYTKTTNANGQCNLKITSKIGKYTVKIKYSGNENYISSSKSFKLKIYKLKTKITVKSTSIIRGKYMYIFLKDNNGNALSSKAVTIKFNKKTFKKYTNKNGEAKLKITSKAGKYPVKIIYAGSTTYLSTSKSFKAKSCLDKTKITVSNSQIIKGNYLYAYLKNSANKPISKQKVIITFNNKKYTKTTNANGRISLKINVKTSNYKTIIKYSGSTHYKSSSKTLTIKVIANTNAKIIATNNNLSSSKGVKSIGSGISINKKTIVLDSDNIYNKATDTKLLNDIATILRSKGYTVIVNTNINPNAHCSDIMGKYSNVCVFCIFGGVDSGMFIDMSSKWYQNYLKKYNNEVVLGFTKTSRNLATETWLERAHDDNYSPSSFTGLANPGTYLNENGFDYVYGDTAKQLAENFLNYAIKGLSIGNSTNKY